MQWCVLLKGSNLFSLLRSLLLWEPHIYEPFYLCISLGEIRSFEILWLDVESILQICLFLFISIYQKPNTAPCLFCHKIKKRKKGWTLSSADKLLILNVTFSAGFFNFVLILVFFFFLAPFNLFCFFGVQFVLLHLLIKFSNLMVFNFLLYHCSTLMCVKFSPNT